MVIECRGFLNNFAPVKRLDPGLSFLLSRYLVLKLSVEKFKLKIFVQRNSNLKNTKTVNDNL